MTEIEIWTKWESQIVNGLYPLRRFLGRSNHSVVFLTEHRAQSPAKAAIKLVPAEPALAEAQLSNWRRIAALSHPHLIRTFDSGRCRLGGHPFLFVVMEYADQTLAQLLPHRALTPSELREMLIPTLDALAYLHGRRLVQGQLKPPNFLVVGDQLKLASDTIRAFGEPAPSIAKPSLYDPPEARGGAIDGAGDVWGLGISVVEALTQRLPALDEVSIVTPALPPAYQSAVHQCLNRSPAERPTMSELQVQFGLSQPAVEAPNPAAAEAPSPTAPHTAAPSSSTEPQSTAPQSAASQPIAPPAAAPQSAPPQSTAVHSSAASQTIAPPAHQARPQQPLARQPPTHQSRPPPPPAHQPPTHRPSAQSNPRAPLLGLGVGAGVILLVATWAVMHAHRPHLGPEPGSVGPPSSSPSPDPRAAPQNSASTPATTAVLHQETPVLSHRTRNTIHGQVKVTVLVTVDRSGVVVGEDVRNPGSSKYFTRLAVDAAKKWQFAPAETPEPQQWLLEFDFTRGGVAARATSGGAGVHRG
jgi:TonB family protein